MKPTAAAAQAKCSRFGGDCAESSNRTSKLSLAVYQFRKRISLTVSGCGKIKSKTDAPEDQLDMFSSKIR